ncbi:MAG: hypothetical protein HY704_17090, partial [Gemmatimonadetes bacterium]|nr:hypothetical protein [Gemmatimonadota bacterium]
RQMVDSREIFHPLRWTVGEAHRFLQDVPELERAGVIVRMPSNWSAVAAGPWLAETLRRLRSPDDELACEEAVHELRGTLRTHQRAGVRWLNLLQHLVARVDLVITSYASLLRLPWLASTSWDFVILDEAQAIKNPNAKQTRAAKPSRPWRCRSCLSCGTP